MSAYLQFGGNLSFRVISRAQQCSRFFQVRFCKRSWSATKPPPPPRGLRDAARQAGRIAGKGTRAELIEAIRHGSAVTWQHFNLHGEFDFSDERMVDSMGLAASPKNPAFE